MSTLKKLYKDLDFRSGDLMSAADRPCRKRTDWLEKGEWLAAGKRAGVDRLFFVNNSPVAVFSECDENPQNKIKAFNRAWCLARPRLLFLASPGELTVYDLNQPPIDENNEAEWEKLKHLETLNDIAEVATHLQQYHRDHLESGSLFEDHRFGDLNHRADKALIRDLKTVRHELIEKGLSGSKSRIAHALIGRSIFIRYLEDRGVLTEEYFRNVAGTTAGWTQLLNTPDNRAGIDFSTNKSLYARVLANKEFTYALFSKLAKDFNGDMFPDIQNEKKIVKKKHLTLLQDLLFSDVGSQKKLFFYSYQFDIIPLDLISSIYEEFYHSSTEVAEKKSKARQDGAYYTPAVLVEFVLSRVLTSSVLKKNPRILDPACGSGIFLVEAFRRIVRHQWHLHKKSPTFEELKTILKDQIAGIEANSEAARIAAFSLYLAMLHYLDPPAIVRQIKNGNRLPNLVASNSSSANHFHCILPGNAFDIASIESNSLWRDRFGPGCTDVVVGNPPWGAPGNNSDTDTKERHQVMLNWCVRNEKPIGGEEPSQAFLWRALDLLKQNGKAGMLVSFGVLFNDSNTSQIFRTQWLESIKLREVTNFSHVRKFFFRGVISPFLAVTFSKSKQNGSPVQYWSAKQTQLLNGIQSVVLSLYDRSMFVDEPLADKELWKTHLWGAQSDWRLLKRLRNFTCLDALIDRSRCGQGFKKSPPKYLAKELACFRMLPVNEFSRYGEIQASSSPPSRVYRKGIITAYEGQRLLLKRGISAGGHIACRYTDKPFCFTSALIGLKLVSDDRQDYMILLGILWSSLTRYLLFLTTSTWGQWHDAVDLTTELLKLPVILDKKRPESKRIISIVSKLSNYNPQERSLQNPRGKTQQQIETQIQAWEQKLNDVVFELYELSEEEKDLVRDMFDVTLPFMYKPFDSHGSNPAVNGNDGSWMEQYARIFSRRWQPYLNDDEEMRAEVHVGAHGNMVAMEFYPADEHDSWDLAPKSDWGYVLDQLSNSLPIPMGTSQIVLDGVVHVVSERGIIIIKRNVKRLWTRSLAREDADSTLAKQLIQTMPKEGVLG